MQKKSKTRKVKAWQKTPLELIDERITLWTSHATDGPLASPYSHLTLVGELNVIKEMIIQHTLPQPKIKKLTK